MREFLNSSYEDEIEREKKIIEREHNEKYEKLADSVRPSFWYGVLHIILKMNGSWDILLNNLLK